MAIDQAHEQNNATVKGDGGAVGLTENPASLHHWMVSGLEMARIIGEFEISTKKRKDKDVQMAFARDVKALSEAIDEIGNPFSEESSDLLVLDNRNIADTAVADMVHQIEKLGRDQYRAHVEERLVNRTKYHRSNQTQQPRSKSGKQLQLQH